MEEETVEQESVGIDKSKGMETKGLDIKLNIIWNAVGCTFYMGCQWLLTVLVVRISGVDTAGLFSLAISVCNIWYAIALYGMRNFQVSDTLGKYSDGTYIISRWVTTGIGLFGCILYTMIISYNTEQRICILIYYIFKSSEGIFDIYTGIYQKKWRLDYAGKSMILRGLLSSGVFLGSLILFNQLSVAIIAMTIVCFLAIIFYDIPKLKKLTNMALDLNLDSLIGLLKECFPLVIYTLLSTIIASVPKLVIERILGSYELGIYNSIAMPTVIVQMGATYFFGPYITVFSEKYLRKDIDGFLNTLKKCIKAIIVISVAALLGSRLFGYFGLYILYGNEVAGYVYLLLPLIICTIMTALAWLLCGVLTSIRSFHSLVVANIAAVIDSLVLSVLCVKQYGMQGASIALIISLLLEIIVLSLDLNNKVRKK